MVPWPRPGPRSLVHVIMIIIWIITIRGLVWVVGIVTGHHVFSPGLRWTHSDLLLGLVCPVPPLRPRALTGPVTVMLAVLSPSHQRSHKAPLDGRCRGRRLLLLLSHRLALGVRMSRVPITDDGDSSLLHLLLRCAPPPRCLILRALAQNAKNLPVVGPLQRVPQSRSLVISHLRPGVSLRLGRLQDEHK